ncbi:MAG: AAA family ATPase [Nanoarchaeota archaeon]
MDLTSFGVEKKKPQEINSESLDVNFDTIKENFTKKVEDYHLPWFLKYKADTLDSFVITKEIQQIFDFIQKPQKGKGVLLVGPPGSGKTTTVTIIAKKLGLELFELNASDTRNKKSIEEIIGQVLNQKSLFGQEKLILIDEVDGVSGNNDRGGVAQIIKFVKNSKIPFCFTANDKESDKISALKKTCLTIDFENYSKELLKAIANKIFCELEISYDSKELENFIEERNTTDVRGFINDLQASVTNKKFYPDSRLEIRSYKKLIENLLDKIFFSYGEDALKSTFNSDVNIDDLFLYLEENAPNVMCKKALILAYNEIAKADIYRGRIRKWQHWRFLVYVNFYLTFGVSNSKISPKKVPYKRNQRILKKWIYNNSYSGLGSRTKIQKQNKDPEKFIEKLAGTVKTSIKKTRSEDIFYFMFAYKNSPEFKEKADSIFEIDESTKKSFDKF